MTPYLLLDATIKTSMILAVALLAAALLRRRSAAIRHWVLTMGVAGALVAPLAALWLPAWDAASAFSAAASGTEMSAGPAPQRGVSTSTSFRIAGSERASDAESASSVWLPAAVGRLTTVWAVGAALFVAWLAVGLGRLAWLSRRAKPIGDGVWRREAALLARHYGLRRAPRLVRSAHPTLLVARGWLRATVIVPASAKHWPVDRVRVVIAHEFAHVARADSMTLIAAELLRALHWFNPLAWIVSRRLRHESERACDDLVLGSGTNPYAYANHLVDVARELRARPLGLPAPAMAIPSSLERRIVAMMNASLDRNRPSRISRALALVTCLLFTAVVSSAQSPSSGISGRVVDQTGGTVPGVNITVENEADEIVATAVTSVAGQYKVEDLLPGTYSVTAEMAAFKKTVRTGIAVTSATVAETNLTLEVGALQETVSLRGPNSGGRSVAENVDQARADTSRLLAGCASRSYSSPPSGSNPSGPIRVGGEIRGPRKLVHVTPVYPSALAEQNVGGLVILEAMIAEDGLVEDVEVLRDPNAELAQAAANAIGAWEFTPALLNGCPVPVLMSVTVNFEK